MDQILSSLTHIVLASLAILVFVLSILYPIDDKDSKAEEE